MSPQPPSRPALSVVIPVRDRQAALSRLLGSLTRDAAAAGASDRIEIIVVDDGSDPPIVPPAGVAHLIRRPKRCGANAARRLGLAAARGGHVHFHDSDDDIVPGWTAAVLAAIDAHPQAGVLVTRRLDEVGGARLSVRQAYFERQAARPDRIRRALAFRNVLGPFGGVVFARDDLADARFADMASSQDWAVYRDVYVREPVGAAVPEARFVYRRGGADRISASPRRKALGMFALLRAWRGGPAHGFMRLHHLHLFRRFLRRCGRRDLDRILRRTRVRRVIAFAAASLYLFLALRRS